MDWRITIAHTSIRECYCSRWYLYCRRARASIVRLSEKTSRGIAYAVDREMLDVWVVLPSSDSRHHASRPQKAQTASRSHTNTLSQADLHQMVLHRPVECTALTRYVDYFRARHSGMCKRMLGRIPWP